MRFEREGGHAGEQCVVTLATEAATPEQASASQRAHVHVAGLLSSVWLCATLLLAAVAPPGLRWLSWVVAPLGVGTLAWGCWAWWQEWFNGAVRARALTILAVVVLVALVDSALFHPFLPGALLRLLLGLAGAGIVLVAAFRRRGPAQDARWAVGLVGVMLVLLPTVDWAGVERFGLRLRLGLVEHRLRSDAALVLRQPAPAAGRLGGPFRADTEDEGRSVAAWHLGGGAPSRGHGLVYDPEGVMRSGEHVMAATGYPFRWDGARCEHLAAEWFFCRLA